MDDALAQLNEHFLSCNICTEIFKDPCTIDCQHTFCKKCLTQYTKTRREVITAKSILCPNCRQMTKVPRPQEPVDQWCQQFKPSFLIQGLLDTFTSQGSSGPIEHHCFVCQQIGKTTQAKSVCQDCDILLCEPCAKIHQATPVLTGHVISPQGTGSTPQLKKRKCMCKEHNCLVELCCRGCQNAVCQKCCIVYHRECRSVITLESMIPEMKQVLQQNSDQINSHMQEAGITLKSRRSKVEEITQHKSSLQSEIRRISQQAMDLIRRKETKLMDELDTLTETLLGKLKGQIKSGEIDLQTYQQYNEFIRQVLQSDSPMDLYEMYTLCQSGEITAELQRNKKQKDEAKKFFFEIYLDVDQLDKTFQLGTLKYMEEKVDHNDGHNLLSAVGTGTTVPTLRPAPNTGTTEPTLLPVPYPGTTVPTLRPVPYPGTTVPTLRPAPNTGTTVPKLRPAPNTGTTVHKLRPVPNNGKRVHKLRPAPNTGTTVHKLRPVPYPGTTVPTLRPAPTTGTTVPTLRPAPNTGTRVHKLRPVHYPGTTVPKLRPAPNNGKRVHKLRPIPYPGTTVPTLRPAPNTGTTVPKLRPAPNTGTTVPKLRPVPYPGTALPTYLPAPNTGTTVPTLRPAPNNGTRVHKLRSVPYPGTTVPTYLPAPTTGATIPKCLPTVSTGTNNDTKHQEQTDIEVLDIDGIETVAATDVRNKNVKYCYTRSDRPHCTSLAVWEPFRLTKFGHDRVAVSYLSHNSIELIKLTPDPVLLSSIKTKKKYKCLIALRDTALAAGFGDLPTINILDLSGRVLRSVITPSTGQQLIQSPWYMCTTRQGNIVVTDVASGFVNCVTQQGTIVFSYKLAGDDDGNYDGVSTTDTDSVIVADWGHNKIIQLSERGEYERDLLTEKDGIAVPRGLRVHGNKLYVTGECFEYIKVFQM